MENTQELLRKLSLEKNISLQEMPDIDLYMDQVIQLFDHTFKSTKRNEEEKVLTKTMINNYAKAKLFIPIKNKKYSKKHLILISLVYQLKGALSINDIKSTLDGLNSKLTNEDFELEKFYNSYLAIQSGNASDFESEFQKRAIDVHKEVAQMKDSEAEKLEKILLITSLVNISNSYRRAAELLIDELKEESQRVTGDVLPKK
ncbi:DUF1836 domain-containing protein [Paenisporosarcina sp. FSL H8-0542]|uniref:DUF1836 domain-containing protein n=1 Tax=unclassified Paenisporosarcina TaxID=2642018 RepID=UPI00034E6EA7|nr:DUF1836 domain-containing protein [Paenisporosarcina sp. HGH0030]EPD51394.1 hypothetical protein HMPREF1210_01992 [Paenisporosarcina sp. HGH0030]